jgi:apolipoprotein N-acyltransferase
VRLLQGNVPQNLKFDPIRSERAMRDYVGAVDGARTHLTVLPETAWTIPWQQTPRELALELLKKVEMTGGVIAIGKPIVDSESNQDRRNPSITNGIGVFDSSGRQVSRYDKRHLVPFGEFVPWGFRWFVNLMNIPLGEFRRGAREQALLTIGPERIAFNICYEDLFGDELAEQVRQGATLLINATNIGWFGQSHALGQHLQIARMRSLELARPMLRATNTGVTAAIDHRGRVLAQIPAHQPGSLIVDVRGQTAMTLFGRWGHIPLLGLSMVFALIALAGLRSAGGSERNR